MEQLTPTSAGRFARLALDCVTREYPNKISHVLNSPADALPPRRLTPAFYGCFDWHSAVHGHWLLVRLARLFPDAPYAEDARAALRRNITADNIQAEVEYIRGEGRTSFERPYGLAWLLALGAELRQSDVLPPDALGPLEQAVKEKVVEWLPKLPRPDRSGQHSNTAFGMGLMLDAARATGDTAFEDLLVRRAHDFYIADHACPLEWEPSGEDFLSPCLAEADLMRRVLDPTDFVFWVAAFLPEVRGFQPITSPDQSDGKLAHLDGLCLSRAWMLNGIARALPAGDARRGALTALAESHAAAGLAAITSERYEGGHWLGTFAVYLLTTP